MLSYGAEKFKRMKRGKLMKTEELYNFIVDTHPQINGDFNQCVDIKAVFRTAGKYAKPNKIFYNDSEKQREELKKFIDTLDASGRAYCLYYSVYTFNPEGKQTITKDNAQSTQILCADFDHITEKEFSTIFDKLKESGLEPNYSIFSGHGFQIIYKLDKPSTDKELLAEFTDAMKANGYPVDEKIKDCARVMRMPFTVNNKDPEKPINTYIYSTHEGVYSLQDIQNKLGMKKQAQKEEPTAKQTPAETQDFTAYDNAFLQQKYTCISIDKLQEPIKAVLMGLRNGYTDKQIRGIVLYLRDYEGAGLDAIISTVQTLASIDTYNYTGDVIPDIPRKVKALFFNREYKFNWDDLKEFGNMDGKVIDRSNLKLNNSTLKEEISNKAFYVYLRLLLEKEYEHKIAFTITEVSQACNISERSIRTRLEELAKSGLIDKKRALKKEGGKYVYIVSKFGIDRTKGFTKININVLATMLKAVDDKIINETVIKFLLYMKCIAQGAQGADGTIAVSQTEIAKHLNITKNAVTMLWEKVEELNKANKCIYIKRGKTWLDKDKYSYYYELYY